jgi:hypothetical protein
MKVIWNIQSVAEAKGIAGYYTFWNYMKVEE